MDASTITAILGAIGGTTGLGGLLAWWGGRGARRAELTDRLNALSGRAIEKVEAENGELISRNGLLVWKVDQLVVQLRRLIARHEDATGDDLAEVRSKVREIELRETL